MTRVDYDRVGKRLTCVGHSGYAERGKDIVCAAVSATVRVIIVSAMREGGKANVIDGGVEVILGDEADASVTVTDVAVECLEALASEYPDCVSVCSH